MPDCDAINESRAQLVVRQLDDALVLALKQRAARSGRSAEAEHREILREPLASELQRPSFKRFLLEMPAPPRERGPCHRARVDGVRAVSATRRTRAGQ